MSNNEDAKKHECQNQSVTSQNRGANSKPNDSNQQIPTTSKNENKGANNVEKNPDGTIQNWANERKSYDSDWTPPYTKKNDSDTISTGTAGSLLYSTSGESSSSLYTYDDLVIRDDASVYIELTKDIAESITASIAGAVEGTILPELLTNTRGNILATLALWASTHIKGSTNMEPLEDKENIIDLVKYIKVSVKKLEQSRSQVRFTDVGIKILDSDDPSRPTSPRTSLHYPKTKKVKSELFKVKYDTAPVQESNKLWEKINSIVNLLKALCFVNCKNDNKDVRKKESSDSKDAFENPVPSTSKDPVPLKDLEKQSSQQMITLKPRTQPISRENTNSDSTNNLSKKGGEITPRPKHSRSSIKEKKSKSAIKLKDSDSKVNTNDKSHSNLNLDSTANLRIASSVLEAGLKQRNRSFIGLTQLIQNGTFKEQSNVKELINLLTGSKATKDWAKEGKFFFHHSEDLRTFGTLLAQIVGGCVLNGIIVPTQGSYLSLKRVQLSLQSLKIETENELISGFLRAIEMSDGVDQFARGFQDGIHFFAPGIRRY